MNFIVGLITIWIAWKIVQFIWYFAEGIDHELEDQKGHILRTYRGPMIREMQPKKKKRLFDKR